METVMLMLLYAPCWPKAGPAPWPDWPNRLQQTWQSQGVHVKAQHPGSKLQLIVNLLLVMPAAGQLFVSADW